MFNARSRLRKRPSSIVFLEGGILMPHLSLMKELKQRKTFSDMTGILGLLLVFSDSIDKSNKRDKGKPVTIPDSTPVDLLPTNSTDAI